MLVEVSVVEQRYQAVHEVLREGGRVVEVAARLGVSRQTVHTWINRYCAEGIDGLFRLGEPTSADALPPSTQTIDPRRDGDDWVTRQVASNGVICVAWQQLSVGKHYAGERVDVYVRPELLEV